MMIPPETKKLLSQLPERLLNVLPDATEVYVVGGSLRDMIADVSPVRELDILVTGIDGEALLQILREFGYAENVGKSFSVIKWHLGKGNVIDVSLPSMRNIEIPSGSRIIPEMSLEDDLAQRDFTVDALALNLRNGEFHDPFGGAKDLDRGVLRAVDDNSLNADPIRCLRGAYICARCNLKPDDRTFSLIKKASPKLSDIAPERIGEELRKLLLCLRKPSEALRFWRDWGILKIIIPELSVGVGVTQEGGWHAYDVFEHLLHTVDAAPAILDVRLAALFHDIGKPSRRRYLREDDRAIFYGHQQTGERMTRAVMERLKFSNALTDRVCRLVRHHMFTHAETDKGVRRFIRRVGEDILDELFMLRYADIEAQGTDREQLSDREYQERVRSILDERPPLSFRDLAVDGEDVMKILGISEGPRVGEILEALLEKVIENPSANERSVLIRALREKKTGKIF